MGELYKLTFPNGKCYIGISTVSAAHRYKGHAVAAKKCDRNAKLYNAWRKHGAPALTVLAILEDSELAAAEMRAVAAYEAFGPRGYNSTVGGETAPTKSPEVAAKVSAAMMGNKRCLGYKHTTESKVKRSAAAKGNANWLGRGHSPETKAKMRIAALGNTRSVGNKNLLGKRHSPETKAKMSAAKLGKKQEWRMSYCGGAEPPSSVT